VTASSLSELAEVEPCSLQIFLHTEFLIVGVKLYFFFFCSFPGSIFLLLKLSENECAILVSTRLFLVGITNLVLGVGRVVLEGASSVFDAADDVAMGATW
jgi:hypothetical protein